MHMNTVPELPFLRRIEALAKFALRPKRSTKSAAFAFYGYNNESRPSLGRRRLNASATTNANMTAPRRDDVAESRRQPQIDVVPGVSPLPPAASRRFILHRGIEASKRRWKSSMRGGVWGEKRRRRSEAPNVRTLQLPFSLAALRRRIHQCNR